MLVLLATTGYQSKVSKCGSEGGVLFSNKQQQPIVYARIPNNDIVRQHDRIKDIFKQTVIFICTMIFMAGCSCVFSLCSFIIAEYR